MLFVLGSIRWFLLLLSVFGWMSNKTYCKAIIYGILVLLTIMVQKGDSAVSKLMECG